MRKERMIIENAVELTFFTVLEQVDSILHSHMKSCVTCMPDFLVKSISNWFATSITDVAAASRMIDAFLVSHPSMPVYCAVAMFTCHRQRILECQNIDQLRGAFQSLPLFVVGCDGAVDPDDDLLSVEFRVSRTQSSASIAEAERVIATGLQFMSVLLLLHFAIVYGFERDSLHVGSMLTLYLSHLNIIMPTGNLSRLQNLIMRLKHSVVGRAWRQLLLPLRCLMRRAFLNGRRLTHRSTNTIFFAGPDRCDKKMFTRK